MVSSSSPKIFIIADSAEYRALLGHHLTSHWPAAKVREFDSLSSGRLPEGFSGAGNDLVILGHPAAELDSLEWLRQFNNVPQFPPVLVVGTGEERHIIEAMRLGAAEYLSIGRLNHANLVELVSAVLGTEKQSAQRFKDSELPALKGYSIESLISRNDVSAVYLGREEATGRQTVLKLLRQMPDSGSEVAFDRFLREYELIAKLDHPNIVTIYDLGVADDHAYIAMEYCGEGTLKRRITAGLDVAIACRYLRHMAEALGELHRVGIMHRDLKPTNVMFRADGSLVLIDFGLAREAQLLSEITGTGEIFGTPYYMSPEQGHGAAVDQRSDIYSLGIIFFEMLTGKKAYEADTAMAMIIKHRQAPIPRLPKALAGYQAVIDRMLAKDPNERFQSAAEVFNAVAKLGADTASAAQA